MKKRIVVEIPEELKKQVKIMLIDNNITLNVYIIGILKKCVLQDKAFQKDCMKTGLEELMKDKLK